jgi:hypothetical protein
MKIVLKKDKLINNVLTEAGTIVEVHEIFETPWLANGDAIEYIEEAKKTNKANK